jgi:Mg-chelatase subunit ChlD
MTDESHDERDGRDERLRRWRLILGGENNSDGTGHKLTGGDQDMDRVLGELYGGGEGKGGKGDRPGGKHGGSGASMPNVSRWLGDIRKYFPASVVQIMQQDAIDKVGLRALLNQPEILEMVQPDVHLVADLISMKDVIPGKTKETARLVVRKVVDDLMARLRNKTQQAIMGALNRAQRNRRPRHNEIDWNRTIRANLKHYQPNYKTVIPETRIGYGRKRSALREVILCIDQSGSMAASVVYSSIFGAVMASLPALKTHMVVFDTSVVDLTPELHDPVDVLFGTQLGGGTDIAQAIAYCRTLIRRPTETILILISDLYEGGVREKLLQQAAEIVASGTQFVTLLALSDEGRPSYDGSLAAELAELGVPSFACTPDAFPELMATVLNRASIADWAARNSIKLAKASDAIP